MKTRKLFLLVLIIAIVCVFTNCTESNYDLNETSTDISPSAEAKQMSTIELIESFRTSVNSNQQSRSGAMPKLVVESIEDQKIEVEITSEVLQTRAGDPKLANGKTQVKLETYIFRCFNLNNFYL